MISEDSEPKNRELNAEIGPELAGMRLDQAMARLFDEFSRSQLQDWIRDGQVKLNNQSPRQRDKVATGDRVQLFVQPEEQVDCKPQDIPLDAVFEDEHILVINKPADLVVHPAAGNPDGTLQNGLLHHCPELINLPRAGIIHRLDKDTTGLMVVAKSQLAHKVLVEALQARDVKREYRALVIGKVRAGGTVDAPIGRHPSQRTKMAVSPMGKTAVSHYRVAERFREHTLLQVNLETGRTHQIRVHMMHIRHPVVGDPVYGGRPKLPARADDALVVALRNFKRQALHAYRLGFQHPATGEGMSWEAEMPEDMLSLIDLLRSDAETHS